MSEEHGYQRSGKKCREKFENLYKYYKKTKDGKAGRQDGKHYRFFRQLEALYGETSNSAVSGHEIGNNFRYHGTPSCNTDQTRHHQEVYHTQKLICDNSLSLSNSSEFEPSSSDDDDNDLSTADHHAAIMMENDSSEKQRKKKRGNWKTKIKEFIDSQMRKLVERQEAWLDKLTKTLEEKEKERIKREEEWRQEEAGRIDREHKFWAKERALIEARDAALMESLQNLTGKYKQCLIKSRTTTSSDDHQKQNDNDNYQNDDEVDGISENINKKKKESNHYNKKRKDGNSIRGSSSGYYANNVEESGLYSASQGRGAYCEGSSPSNSNAANNNIVGVNDSCFRFLMADGENNNLWENYGLKLSNGDQNQ